MSSSFAVKLLTRRSSIPYWQRANETLDGYKGRVLMDHGRFLILEGQGPVEGVTVYEFPSTDAAQSWYDSVADREIRQHWKKGCKVFGSPDRGRSGARRAPDAAHHSRWLTSAGDGRSELASVLRLSTSNLSAASDHSEER